MPGASSQSLMIQSIGGVSVVEFLDKSLLDPAHVERIRQEMLDLVQRAGLPKVIISFDNVTHVSSAMLGVLIEAGKLCKQKKGQLRLAGLPSAVLQVMKVTRLDSMFPIFENTDKAMARF